MNKIVTKKVIYRGKEIDVNDLKDNSNLMIEVECEHGVRSVRWCRRNQPCRKCNIDLNVYNTSHKGRKVTWGNKISKSKKGKKFTESHKKALIEVRKRKLCELNNISENEFDGFPTKGTQAKLRRKIAKAFRKSVIHKSVKEWDDFFYEKLGYSTEELKQHLESQFKTGMTWDNYGDWEIDHVVPESWFNYKTYDDPEFKKCWDVNNFQPLWRKENKCKGNRYSGKYRPRQFIMLCGQSGVGKTTLINQFTDKFNIVHFDKVNMKTLDSFIRNNYYKDKPIVLDIPIKISTIYKRYCENYNIHTVFLIEPQDIVKDRLMNRKGSTKSVDNRYRRMLVLADRYGDFVGNTEEVYSYLEQL